MKTVGSGQPETRPPVTMVRSVCASRLWPGRSTESRATRGRAGKLACGETAIVEPGDLTAGFVAGNCFGFVVEGAHQVEQVQDLEGLQRGAARPYESYVTALVASGNTHLDNDAESGLST